ncbi:hypothetical protein MLD52_09025 [Puniceicoccaceae bacterium K14]|nr:hypothetical protein [Puniceicoccaceae bacterium K14]
MIKGLGEFYPRVGDGKREASPSKGFVFSIPFEKEEDAAKYAGLGEFIIHYVAFEKDMITYQVSHRETGAGFKDTIAVCIFKCYATACFIIGQKADAIMVQLEKMREQDAKKVEVVGS